MEQKLYRQGDFKDLPHGLSLESVSLVETPDGVAFQGHNNPLSNMYACKLKDNQGREANSVEQLYAMRMVEVCGADLRTQKMIKTETNPYTIKSLTRKLHKSQAWMRIRNDVLKEVVELKFLSHPSLMNKLLSLQKEYFYEATLDPVYGCGYMLAQANHVTANKVKESVNVMGKILQQIRDFHKPRN